MSVQVVDQVNVIAMTRQIDRNDNYPYIGLPLPVPSIEGGATVHTLMLLRQTNPRIRLAMLMTTLGNGEI